LEEQLININDLHAELEQKQEELKKLEQTKKLQENKLEIISKTMEYLNLANNNLSAKYLSPLSSSLCKYMKLLTGEDFDKLKIDIDLKCSVEVFGKNRELAYLSKGYKGAIDVCLRFALIDTLFDKQKPFVLLDDPFVNLDEEKLNKALNMLNELSKNYQIIYLTCHNSRVPK